MGSRFKKNYMPTVGSDFSYLERFIDGEKYRLLIWDLAGETKFKNVRSLYFQGAFGAIVVFDLTNRESFLDLENWIKEIEEITPTGGIPFYIVGNKYDLLLDSNDQEMSDAEIEDLIHKLKEQFGGKFEIGFIKSSAKSGMNVDSLFEELVRNIMIWLPNRKNMK